MNVVELTWNAIETHHEVPCFFFTSPSPCADSEREREAEVENEGQRGHVEKLKRVVVAKHSYRTLNNVRYPPIIRRAKM